MNINTGKYILVNYDVLGYNRNIKKTMDEHFKQLTNLNKPEIIKQNILKESLHFYKNEYNHVRFCRLYTIW